MNGKSKNPPAFLLLFAQRVAHLIFSRSYRQELDTVVEVEAGIAVGGLVPHENY